MQALGPQILLPDEEFAVQLGFEKPSLDEPIVVSCLAGIRARTAQLALMAVGYNNVRLEPVCLIICRMSVLLGISGFGPHLLCPYLI